jgi:Bacterial protein of unknown function (DUF839)
MRKAATAIALVVALGFGVVSAALAGLDFGLDQQNLLQSKSLPLFGVGKPIDASSQDSLTAVQASADETALATLANGLSARVVTRSTGGIAAPVVDMMALWPNDTNPTWLIACNEEGSGQVALQRIRISDGLAETIVNSGLVSCDPAHRTPWGTIVFAEENGTSGRLFELIDPLTTTGVSLVGGTPTCVSPPAAAGCTGETNIVERTAVGRLSFEGIGITPNGVMYYGDENRPLNGTPGGAYFKFIPTCAPTNTCPVGSLPGATNAAKLAASPLASAGNIYGLRLGKRAGNTDYGQGTQTGRGTWIPEVGVAPINLRASAASQFLTGYYRPEDLEFDFEAIADGNVRFCGNNTGNEGDDRNYGETICVTDGTLAQAASTAPLSIPAVQYLVIGYPQFAMMDNIAHQPGRGNWVIHEDGDQLLGNNDLWDCLPDGADDDLLSGGCVRIGTLNDLTAEWTGGVFDASGTRFFVSVQHNITGHGVVLEIAGWK